MQLNRLENYNVWYSSSRDLQCQPRSEKWDHTASSAAAAERWLWFCFSREFQELNREFVEKCRRRLGFVFYILVKLGD